MKTWTLFHSLIFKKIGLTRKKNLWKIQKNSRTSFFRWKNDFFSFSRRVQNMSQSILIFIPGITFRFCSIRNLFKILPLIKKGSKKGVESGRLDHFSTFLIYCSEQSSFDAESTATFKNITMVDKKIRKIHKKFFLKFFQK